MGFFNWAAPMFGHFADRWDAAGIEQITGWLSPFVESRRPARLLDVGGGTGALARRLHDAMGAEVTVLDPTPEMVRYIPPDGPVSCVIGTAEAMPFDDDAFDAIIVTDAFHHFRDQAGAAREFARVVRHGGGILVVELDPRTWQIKIIAPLERLLGEPGSFLSPTEMCAFMAGHGIEGDCARYTAISYRFIGRIEKKPTPT